MIVELAFVVVLIVFLYNYFRKPDGLPPGDWGWPIIGKLPSKGKAFKRYIDQMRRKHGDVFCVKIGSITNVFLCDFDLIKEALARPEMTGRNRAIGIAFFTHSRNVGLVFSTGEVWRDQRRFALHHLKNFGMGSSRMESSIIKQVGQLIKCFDARLNKPIHVEYEINIAILNVIWSLVADRSYDVDDDEMRTFSEWITNFFCIIDGPFALIYFFPWLRHCLPQIVINKWMKRDQLVELRTKLEDFIKRTIKEHQDELDLSSPKDYIDSYLIEMQKEECKTFTIEHLICNTVDLFIAGSETTSSYFRWFVIYMATNQDVQERFFREISNVIPKDRFPSFNDKVSLPYVEAVIHEIHRIIAFVPFSLPHCATDDMSIGGFKIPQGTIVNTCIEMCHKNSRYWKRADEFYPENFLSDEGKFFIPKQGFLPFSIGKRACLGESLAKMEIFLFTTTIIQRYKILSPGGKDISLECSDDSKLLNYAPLTEIILTKRE